MAPAVEWVRYGRAAAEALRGAIAEAKGGDPLHPVTVVVPSNHVGVATRRLLASGALGPICDRGAGVAAVTFLTVYRLAELSGAPVLAAAGRRPVSTPVLAAAMRAALAADPGVFGPVAAHPATEQALVGAYRELRDLSEPALAAVARTGPRAATVVRLHRATRAALEARWYDEQDLMAAAAATGPPDLGPDEFGTVIVYLPQRLSRPAAELLRTVPHLRVIAATTGAERADGEVLTAVGRVAGAEVLAPAHDPGWVARDGRTRFVTASDADDEVRFAVRQVVAAVASGTRLDRIAILHASPVPYARLVHEQLSAAGIPANGASVVPLSARMAGRTLLGLLALPERGARRQDVMAWLAGAPIHHDGRWAPVNEWERLSREAAVVAGRTDWDRRLLRLAGELDEAAAAEDPLEGRGPRLRARAEAARGLRRFVLGLLDDLSGRGLRPWGEHAAWARELLVRLLGQPERRQGWPDAEVRAAERVDLALARLGALDAVEGPVPLEVFTRTLGLELDADLGRVGRFGDGVLVGSVAMGIGLDLDLVVVLGLAEGTFPGGVHDDSLLPDGEREAAAGELSMRRQRVDREHRELLAALAGAASQLLCVPRGDLRRSSFRVPSRWALELAAAVEGCAPAPDLLDRDRPWIDHVASFDAGLRRLLLPATAQEHRLRTLLCSPENLTTIAPAGAHVVGARRSPAFTRFDGNLSGLAVPSPVTAPTSATRLERWMDCPFAYFLHDLLGVEPVENPEEELRLTPRDRGELVHKVLELFIVSALGRGVPAPDEPWTSADHERIEVIAAGQFAEFAARGLAGRPIFWPREQAMIRRDLHLILDLDSAHRACHRTRPLAAELAFGLRGATLEAVAVPLPDGRTVRFRGKADRVDRADDGTLHIVDYKTGRVGDADKLSEDNPVLEGKRLQLPVYGLAARLHADDPDAAVFAEYWFVSARGQYRRHGIPVTASVVERVGETLAAIVGGIEGGVFPNHPSAKSTSFRNECWYCDPDYLGTTELRGLWERKRADPVLAAYADRVEPFDEDPVDG